MAKTIQNQVPPEFDALYRPVLKLKQLLTSKHNELAGTDVVQGFVIAHYCTFLMLELYRQLGNNIERFIALRTLIEQIMKQDSFLILPEHKSKICSFIDNLGKELNITPKPYVYIAMYSAHLDAVIYRHFSPKIGIYDFIDYYYVEPDTVERMRQYSIAAKVILETYNLSIDSRTRDIII